MPTFLIHQNEQTPLTSPHLFSSMHNRPCGCILWCAAKPKHFPVPSPSAWDLLKLTVFIYILISETLSSFYARKTSNYGGRPWATGCVVTVEYGHSNSHTNTRRVPVLTVHLRFLWFWPWCEHKIFKDDIVEIRYEHWHMGMGDHYEWMEHEDSIILKFSSCHLKKGNTWWERERERVGCQTWLRYKSRSQ